MSTVTGIVYRPILLLLRLLLVLRIHGGLGRRQKMEEWEFVARMEESKWVVASRDSTLKGLHSGRETR